LKQVNFKLQTASSTGTHLQQHEEESKAIEQQLDNLTASLSSMDKKLKQVQFSVVGQREVIA